jgi:hypothetical protein
MQAVKSHFSSKYISDFLILQFTPIKLNQEPTGQNYVIRPLVAQKCSPSQVEWAHIRIRQLESTI